MNTVSLNPDLKSSAANELDPVDMVGLRLRETT